MDSIENAILEHFRQFYDSSVDDLFQILGMSPTNAKNRLSLITKTILADPEVLRAFELGNFQLKTIRLESNGSLKESMSFNQIDYEQIVKEDWGSSYWRDTVTSRFLFVVFKDDRFAIPRLKAMFWSMPELDVEVAKKFWEHTRSRVRSEDFDNFISISQDMVCHVRPKAMNSKDLYTTASGKQVPKKAYWINASYIKEVIG